MINTTTEREPEYPTAQLFLTKRGEHEFQELHDKAEAQIMQPPNVTYISVDMSKPKTEEEINEQKSFPLDSAPVR